MSVCAVSPAHITRLAVTTWRRRNPYLNIESSDVRGAPNGKVTDCLGSKRSTFVPTRQVKMPLWESPLALLAVRCSQQNANWFVVFLPLWKPFSPRSVQKVVKEGKSYWASWLESLHKHRDQRKRGRPGAQSFPTGCCFEVLEFGEYGTMGCWNAAMWEYCAVRMFKCLWGVGDALLPPSVYLFRHKVKGQISPPIFKKNKTKVDVLSFTHIQCKQYLLSEPTHQIQGLLEVPLLKKRQTPDSIQQR